MRFSSFSLLISLLVLSACGGSAPKNYSYTLPPSPGGRLCANQCSEARSYCVETCGLDQRRCTMNVQSQAMQDYDRYTREQFASHTAIELRPRDFERTTTCDDDKKSCVDSCEVNYQPCYEGCGGKVEATSSCQFLCF